jgi:amino acid transporter
MWKSLASTAFIGIALWLLLIISERESEREFILSNLDGISIGLSFLSFLMSMLSVFILRLYQPINEPSHFDEIIVLLETDITMTMVVVFLVQWFTWTDNLFDINWFQLPIMILLVSQAKTIRWGVEIIYSLFRKISKV